MGYFLRLLGPFAIEATPNQTANVNLNRKTRAILAYLAATARPQSRRLLAEMFCQDTNDPAGTLRWHLSQIRRRVAKEIISTDRQETSFNFGAATVDVHQFQMTLTEPETESLARLEKTVNLYRDNFLADLELPDSPEYELWRLGERARY
ncbi:MAG: hypothetical protein KDE04_05955, partial [Anaerolineales bacterium]|nr:hypothetical protein [Anaerolineales bacterium]